MWWFGTRSEWRELGVELARVVTLTNVVHGLGRFATGVVAFGCLAGAILATREVAAEHGTAAATGAALALFAVSGVVIEALDEHGWAWVRPALKWTVRAVLVVWLAAWSVHAIGLGLTLVIGVMLVMGVLALRRMNEIARRLEAAERRERDAGPRP